MQEIQFEKIQTTYAICSYFRYGKIGFVYTSLAGKDMGNETIIATHPTWFRPMIFNGLGSYHAPLSYGDDVIRVDYDVIRFYNGPNSSKQYTGYGFNVFILK